MKKIVPIIFVVIVLVLAGVGYRVVQSRNKESGGAATNEIIPADDFTTTSSGTSTSTGGPTQKMPQAIPVTLTITSPKTGAIVTNPSIAVKGKTTAKAEVFVNDIETLADTNGNFSAVISLDEGENYILVAANDADGNFAQQELTVTYNAGE